MKRLGTARLLTPTEADRTQGNDKDDESKCGCGTKENVREGK